MIDNAERDRILDEAVANYRASFPEGPPFGNRSVKTLRGTWEDSIASGALMPAGFLSVEVSP